MCCPPGVRGDRWVQTSQPWGSRYSAWVEAGSWSCVNQRSVVFTEKEAARLERRAAFSGERRQVSIGSAEHADCETFKEEGILLHLKFLKPILGSDVLFVCCCGRITRHYQHFNHRTSEMFKHGNKAQPLTPGHVLLCHLGKTFKALRVLWFYLWILQHVLMNMKG